MASSRPPSRPGGAQPDEGAGGTVLPPPRPPAESEEALKEELGALPPAATAPRPMLQELRQAYETAQAAERAVARQQAHVRQRYTALVEQLTRVQHQARWARDRGTAHQKLTEAVGLHDHVAELEAQCQRLQRQRTRSRSRSWRRRRPTASVAGGPPRAQRAALVAAGRRGVTARARRAGARPCYPAPDPTRCTNRGG